MYTYMYMTMFDYLVVEKLSFNNKYNIQYQGGKVIFLLSFLRPRRFLFSAKHFGKKIVAREGHQ